MADYDDQLTAAAHAPVASAGGCITLGRRKYAVGLYWQPSPGRVSQAAREAARQPGQMADFFAVRPGNNAGRVPQFGLGQKEYGHTAGMPAAAASLAEEQPGSWIGAFKLPEGWWVVISRDDLVVPDGDVLYAEEAEAKHRVQNEIALGGLQRVYVPDSWSIANTDPMPLSLLMQGRADGRLQNVKLPIRNYLIVLGGLLALAGVGFALFSWQEAEQEQQRLTAEQEAIAQIQRAAELSPPAPPPPPKRDWEDYPLTDIWLDACRNAFSQAPSTLPGWERNEVSCSGNALTVTWQRTTGPAALPPAGTISGDSRTATSTFTFVNVPPRGAEALWPADTLKKKALLNNWQIEIFEVPEEVPPPVAEGQPPPQPKPWLKKKITLTSHNAPWFVWSAYVGIPGFVIERVSWNATQWIVEGIYYEMR